MEKAKADVESATSASDDFDDEGPSSCCWDVAAYLAERVCDTLWITNPSRYPGHVRRARTHCEHDGFDKSH